MSPDPTPTVCFLSPAGSCLGGQVSPDLETEEVRQLLSTIESVKRMGALHHDTESFHQEVAAVHPVKIDHLKIALKLISRGAEVDILDFAGFTPSIHLCVTAYHNEAILKISEMLLRAGADANKQDRLGSTLLLLATDKKTSP